MADTFGDWLIAAMTARNMTRAHLMQEMERAGFPLSRQAVWAWEKNRSRPSDEHTSALRGVLDLNDRERLRMLELRTKRLEGPDDDPSCEAA